MKILVADDSKTSLALIASSIQKLGHEVITAENGQQALEIYQTNKLDLIILDVMMAVMDGFECARKIRAISNESWIPIIFLSASVDDESIAKGIDSGGDDYLTKPVSEITLAAKIKAMQRISDMRQSLYEAKQKLIILSATDVLTGLYNRLQFDKTLSEKISHAKRHLCAFALMFVDLDKFKSVNDNLGHHIGDILLKEVAKSLRSYLRADDFVARIGGDEFAIIISEVKSQNTLENIGNEIIEVLSSPYNLQGHEVQIGSSIGIAMYPVDGIEQVKLLNYADKAMYHVKAAGGNKYQFYSNLQADKEKRGRSR